MGIVVGHSDVTLYTNDPTLRQTNGKPVRIVRSRETNLGDLITDAIRSETNAEVALLNSGGIRTGIDAGDITYGSIIQALPFSNQICVSEVTGQTLLDALEWGARAIPGDIGGFLQVSGLTYEIHADRTPLISVDDNSMFVSVDGAYRVSNVTVNGEPLDLEKTYRVAGIDFILKDGGSGFRMFRKEDVVLDEIKLDNQVLIDYISKQPNGTIGEEYADPYGQGRIQILGLD